MATKEEILAGVTEVLADALAVDEDQVVPEATLVNDLGAESIDILDIVFQLEKRFEIKIDRGELMPEDLLNNPEFVQNEKLTPAGIEELKIRMPYANLEGFEQNPMVQSLMTIVTVNDMCHIVETKLASNGE